MPHQGFSHVSPLDVRSTSMRFIDINLVQNILEVLAEQIFQNIT